MKIHGSRYRFKLTPRGVPVKRHCLSAFPPCSQSASRPSGTAPTVEYRPHQDILVDYVVVDSVRKHARQQPMRTVNGTVNARIQRQRIDVSVKRIEEIIPQGLPLDLVESAPVPQIQLRRPENPNAHAPDSGSDPWPPPTPKSDRRRSPAISCEPRGHLCAKPAKPKSYRSPLGSPTPAP